MFSVNAMSQQYQRFFDELAPRLENAHALERELDTHLARRFNVFDYLRTDELGLSRIVADLLNPEAKHGQGAIFLKLLLDGLRLEDHLRLDVRTVEVEVEKAIKDNRRLDVCVRIDGRYCLAIENKPYAGDQPNQIKDYLDWLRGEGFEKYALIYLSPSGEPPSSESVGVDDLGRLEDGGRFKIVSYHDTEEKEREDGFDHCRLDYALSDWLADCRKHCNVDRLGWFLREAEEFCKRRFGGHTMGNREVEAVRGYVLTDEKLWDVGVAVSDALDQITKDVSWRFLEKIWLTWCDTNKCKNPHDFSLSRRYYSARTKTHLSIYRKSWWSYKNLGEKKCTQIRLEAYQAIGAWDIGIRSPNGGYFDKEQEGYRELKEALERKKEELGTGSEWPEWVWWQRLAAYPDWRLIVPTLHRACVEHDDEHREALMYFVDKFAKIAEVAVPIIDRYEGDQ